MTHTQSLSVAENLAAVRGRIADAAARAGRSAGEVSLLAVTKTVPAPRVREAFEAGQTLFGENRVQEAREKIPALGAGLTWHMIGHLQKNKAKYALDLFHTVESLDSVLLADELDRRAAAAGKKIEVMLQVQVAAEESKSGLPPGEVPPLIEVVLSRPHPVLTGLMTIPPWPETPEGSRPHFAALRELREGWDGRYCPPGTLRELSMGMTMDYEVAVEEGATIVRLGSAIFGARDY